MRDQRDGAASKKGVIENRLLRTSRRYFYNNRVRKNYTAVLAASRKVTSARRSTTFLQARRTVLSASVASANLFAFPNRKQGVFGPIGAAKRADSAESVRSLSVGIARSILQGRNARKRLTTHTYSADRVLRKLPFSLLSEPKRAGRARKKAAVLLSKLESKRDAYLRLLHFAPTDKKLVYQSMFARA